MIIMTKSDNIKQYQCYCSKCMNGVVVKDKYGNYFCDKCFCIINISLNE